MKPAIKSINPVAKNLRLNRAQVVPDKRRKPPRFKEKFRDQA